MELTRRHRRAVALWGGGAVLVAATGIGVSTQLVAEAEPENRGSATTVSTDGPGTSTVSGEVQDSGSTAGARALDVSGAVSGGLSPDVPATLSVTVRNTSDQAVLLRGVQASITRVTSAGLAGVPACDPAWFTVEPSTATRTIGAGRSTVVPLELRLRGTGDNQDNCKSVRFDYSISAAADQLP